MEQTFDFLNDKALTVFKDNTGKRLPVVVKYNGEPLPKLSALTKSVDNSKTNVNEVSYTSEYDKSLQNLSIDGNTIQKTYNGINLFNQELLLEKGNFVKTIYNGVECILAMGHLTIPFEAPAGTYTFSFDWAQPNGMDMWFYIDLEDGTRIPIITQASSVQQPEFTRLVRTVNATSKIVKFRFEVYNYNIKPMYFKDMMLCKGSTTTYEPYVGGIYSPNPGQIITSTKLVWESQPLDMYSWKRIDDYQLGSLQLVSLPKYPAKIRILPSGNSLSTDSSNFIGVAYTESDLTNVGYTYQYLLSAGKYTEVIVDYDFYIGVGNIFGVPVSEEQSYWTALTTTDVLQAEIETIVKTRGRAYPQPIENANGNSLPSEYQQVEYIESTGTQIIDTEFNPTNNTRILLDMKLTNLISDGTGICNTFLGCYDETNVFSINFGTNVEQATELFCWVNARSGNGGTYTTLDVVNDTLNNRNTLSLTNNYVLYGTYYKTLTKGSWTAITTSLRMFGRLSPSGVEEPFKRYNMVLYGAKIYSNDVLVRNFIPCYRKSDNVVGLYDLVSNKFYTNNGTGEFLKGADVPNFTSMSVTIHGDNLFDQEELLPSPYCDDTEYDGVDCIVGKANGVSVDIPCEIPAGTTYFSVETAYPDGADFYFMVQYEDKKTATVVGSSEFPPREYFETDKRRLTHTKKIVKLLFKFFKNKPVYLRNLMVNQGKGYIAYAPYFRQEISMPTKLISTTDKPIVSNGVTLDEGATVPLLFTKWDKLTVDRIANKVIYTEGSWQRKMTGTDGWFKSQGAVNSGYGEYYALNLRNLKANCTNLEGYSNYFKRINWVEAKMYGKFVVSHTANEDVIVCATDTTSPVADFKEWLQERYAEGNPVVFLVKRYTPLEHDITETELGQSILALTNNVRYGTRYLQVNSEQIVPIEVGYAKWGSNIPDDEQ